MVDRLREAPPEHALRMEDVHIYPRAEIAGSRTILSKLLTKSQSTESFWVLVEF